MIYDSKSIKYVFKQRYKHLSDNQLKTKISKYELKAQWLRELMNKRSLKCQ